MPFCLTGCNRSSPPSGTGSGPSGSDGGCSADGGAGCPTCKLVSITVIQNATQTNVTGAKNWAAVKKGSDDVIVQAKTDPDTPDCWNKINWSGDSGTPVPGHPNQRSLSRSTSKKYHVQAELGGVSDSVDVWILWASMTILTSGTTPPHAVQFAVRYDGTETLGARQFSSGTVAVGKVVPVAVITPPGVHDVVKSGWAIHREQMAHLWVNGTKVTSLGGFTFWATTWTDDTSVATFQNLIPDSDDKIYDRDAPNIGRFGSRNAEMYVNFRQWTEWNGETCSEKAPWHWQGRWDSTKTPEVTMAEVSTSHITLPTNPHFRP